jgi:hypothetical protein
MMVSKSLVAGPVNPPLGSNSIREPGSGPGGHAGGGAAGASGDGIGADAATGGCTEGGGATDATKVTESISPSAPGVKARPTKFPTCAPPDVAPPLVNEGCQVP